MKWSYILFLPAAMSLGWIFTTLLTRRHLLRAQLVLCLSMLMAAFATMMLAVFFRARAGQLYIYDYMFEVMSIFTAPTYFLGICSLCNPRGVKRGERWVLIVPLLFALGLTAAASHLGPRRYELMCHEWQQGLLRPHLVDGSWQWLMIWDRILFPILLVVESSVMLFLARRKAHVFTLRFNDFYANSIGANHIDERPLIYLTWAFLPLAVVTILLIALRPFYFKYWIISLSLLLTLLQWGIGLYIYNLRYDARYLAQRMRNKMKNLAP